MANATLGQASKAHGGIDVVKLLMRIFMYFFGTIKMKKLWVVALLALASGVQAESTAGKKELVAKVLQLQQAGIEQAGQALAEQPAAQMMQQASMLLQTKVAADKRETIAKEIQADLKKYVDEAVPLVRERAVSIAPTTIGPLLDERFTEEELKQLIFILESPVNSKFAKMSGDMQKVLAEKLVAETRSVIEPKVKLLEQRVTQRLGLPAAAASAAPATSAAPGAKAPAKATGKAAAK